MSAYPVMWSIEIQLNITAIVRVRQALIVVHMTAMKLNNGPEQEEMKSWTRDSTVRKRCTDT